MQRRVLLGHCGFSARAGLRLCARLPPPPTVRSAAGLCLRPHHPSAPLSLLLRTATSQPSGDGGSSSSSSTDGPTPASSSSSTGAAAQGGAQPSGAGAAPGGADLGADSGDLKLGADNFQFTWRSAIFTCLVCGGCLWYYDYLRWKKESESRAITKHERIGTPRLGGSFELIDRKGKVCTDEDLKGQYLLIYFGFANCPDICPQEMEKQTHAVEMLDGLFGPVVTPVFISVDPKRDAPKEVDEYCKQFHPRLVGLTGTNEQVKAVSRAYRVYYNEGMKNSEKDYLIDHSIIHYFIGKNGKFVDFFGKNMTAKEMVDKMKVAILEDQEKAKQRKQKRGVESLDEE